MKKMSAWCLLLVVALIAFRPKERLPASAKIIFAVLDDGQAIEPIAIVENGKLVQPVNGSDDGGGLTAFSNTYYNPKTTYDLIYGGKAAGKVSVVKSNLDTECGSTTAIVTTSSSKVKLKGFEMALATSVKPNKPASGIRKAVSVADRLAIEKLVAKEFQQNKIIVKGMKLVKLTSIDADNNKVNEIVGTYTVSPSSKERGLIFFIATKSKANSYTLTYSEVETIKEEGVMSGDIKDVDRGVYQEILLDMLDINDDGKAELFTIKSSFEGVGYNSYQLKGNKWEKVLETSLYHCGY
jgi:hypothetical protein